MGYLKKKKKKECDLIAHSGAKHPCHSISSTIHFCRKDGWHFKMSLPERMPAPLSVSMHRIKRKPEEERKEALLT